MGDRRRGGPFQGVSFEDYLRQGDQRAQRVQGLLSPSAATARRNRRAAGEGLWAFASGDKFRESMRQGEIERTGFDPTQPGIEPISRFDMFRARTQRALRDSPLDLMSRVANVTMGASPGEALEPVPGAGRAAMSAARLARRSNVAEEALQRLPAPRETDEVIRATHYGPGAEADFLDVSRQGTGPAAGRETARPDRLPRTHFYTEASPSVNPRLRREPSVELELPKGKYLQPEEASTFFDEARNLTDNPDEVPDLAEDLMDMKGFDGYVGQNGTLVSFRNQPIPAGATGQGVPSVSREAESYAQRAREKGFDVPDPQDHEYLPLDTDLGARTADVFEELPHAPNDPKVQASYRAFKDETLEQYRHLEEQGVKFEPWEGEGQPYANSSEMMDDVRENKHLYYFKTDEGFGAGEGITDHPMLERSPVEIDGEQVPYNDLFRAVHDYFGHSKEGVSFGPRGEFNAANVHSAMYSPEARPSMLFETHGQNSWVMFGPHLRRADGTTPVPGDPDWVPLGQTGSEARPYAPQKANILPLDVAPPAAVPDAMRAGREATESLTPTLDAMSPEEIAEGLAEVERRSAASSRGKNLDRRQSAEPFEGPDRRTGEDRREIDDIEEQLAGRLREDIEARRALGLDLGGGAGDARAGEEQVRRGLTDRLERARNPGPVPPPAAPADLFQPEATIPVLRELPEKPGNAFDLAQARLNRDTATPEAMAARRAEIEQGLTPEELEWLQGSKSDVVANVEEAYSMLPDPETMAHAAIRGAEARGWYDQGHRAIQEMAGQQDTPRFAALMSALSPNKPVDEDLALTIEAWGRWNRAGRPQDEATVRELIENLEVDRAPFRPDENATKPFRPLAESDTDNIVRALTASDEQLATLDPDILSGPKVGPFFSSLGGRRNQLVSDTHMARGYGTTPQRVGKKARGAAQNAMMENATRAFERITGEPVTREELQEMSWAYIRGLSRARKGGPIKKDETALQALEESLLNPERAQNLNDEITSSASIGELMAQPAFRELAERNGLPLPTPRPTYGFRDVNPADADVNALRNIAERIDASRAGKPFYSAAPIAGLLGVTPLRERYERERRRQRRR